MTGDGPRGPSVREESHPHSIKCTESERAHFLILNSDFDSYASSRAFMVMVALSTFETGQPLLAFSAAFWKAA